LGGYALVVTGEETTADLEAALKSTLPRLILLRPVSQEAATFRARKFFSELNAMEAGKSVPTMLWFKYPKVKDEDEDATILVDVATAAKAAPYLV